MKLIMAIVSNEDSNSVTHALTKAGHSFTKLATTGGFLRSGNTTLISGVEDDQVETVISIIAKKSSSRTQVVPSMSGSMDVGVYSSFPVEVTVGGATIFVLNVERFEKV
ncbi:MAG: cyclic-di-AMP receptor [Clostridia bacterium]|nr:cyclic-di-AMP receptor [Clostridia bacterium]